MIMMDVDEYLTPEIGYINNLAMEDSNGEQSYNYRLMRPSKGTGPAGVLPLQLKFVRIFRIVDSKEKNIKNDHLKFIGQMAPKKGKGCFMYTRLEQNH